MASLCDVLTGDDAKVTELLVLASLTSTPGTVSSVAEHIRQPVDVVEAAVARMEAAGLVDTVDGTVVLTPAGQHEAEQIMTSWSPGAAADLLSAIDLSPVTRLVDSVWPDAAGRAAADAQERAGLLAADTDRDAAVQQLSAAFAEGRLSASELETRTSSALSARTYGELDTALHGLGGLRRPARSHPARKVVFWVMSVLLSPFLLMGTLLFAFGSDAGDHLGGLVFLVLLLPGLFALWRWAWPRP
jgi:DNA-binding MarR family transcriptional regulator